MSFDISRYNPVRDISSAYPSVTAGLARALQPPLSGVGYPNPCSIVVGIRGIPISSRIKRAPLPLWGLTLPRVNSPVLSLSPYLVNCPLSVRLSIRLAICFIALSIYLSFCLNHYTHIRVVFHTEFYTCFINAYVCNISFRYKIINNLSNPTLLTYLFLKLHLIL